MKKILIVSGLIVLLAGVAVAVRFASGPEDSWVCQDGQWMKHGNPAGGPPAGQCGMNEREDKPSDLDEPRQNDIVGGDQDEHGCIGSAGYSWCPSTGKCQRMWEDFCEEYKDQFKITDFNSCAEAGNPVMESYPRQCRSKSGENFTEDLGNATGKEDQIRLASPKPNERIKSPLMVTGQARGNWYFEGQFPVSLVNWDGLIIAEGNAVAQGEWTTSNFVPFKVELTFEKPTVYDRGAIILKKSNPSGLPANDDALEIPILYAD